MQNIARKRSMPKVGSPEIRIAYGTLSDEKLVERLQEGKGSENAREAAGELYLRYNNRVSRVCKSVLFDPNLVDDATQETFRKMITKIGGYKADPEDQRRFEKWLSQIARNTSIDMNRRQKLITRRRNGHQFNGMDLDLDVLPNLKDSSPAEVAGERELIQKLRAAVGELSEREQKVLERRLEGKGYGEIASELGIPLGTVKSRLNSAKQRLQSKIR